MIKVLLDTHVVLWIAENSTMLSNKVKNIVLDKTAEKYVSIASALEVAIKLGTKKLRIDGGLLEFFRIIDENGFLMLSIEKNYLHQLSVLPDYHKDPFDRLILATAIVEEMSIITAADENFHKYNVSLLW
ncbi:MAG: type II toxin-antitoxin system VapC family toxin [Holophagales bacterium]|jgi:PIN domain nuclease of toxin-antitoxin system|nr:type II toxin-antitoxin system VapC family toxin [Holophagales bacterium]